jgi:hypothetical protein
MRRLVLEVARWLFAGLALICIAAVSLLDLRSGPALALFVLFLIFGSVAAFLSLQLPVPRIGRKRRW